MRNNDIDGKSKQVTCHLRKKIIEGDFRPGSRFYSDNNLGKHFNVSHVTAAKVINVLASEGFLERIRGKGTFVVNKLPDSAILEKNLIDNLELGILGFLDKANPKSTNSRTYNFIKAFDRKVSQYNCSVKLFNTYPENIINDNILENIKKSGIDGFLFNPSASGDELESEIDKLLSLEIPFVSTVKSNRCHFVDFDNEKIGFDAANHLFKSGCRKIAFISSNSSHYWLDERLLGCKRAYRTNNVCISNNVHISADIVDRNKAGMFDAARLLEFLLKNNFDGAVINGDNNSRLILEEAEKKKIPVPGKLSVVSIDDLFEYRHLDMTAVNISYYELGLAAFSLLNEIVRNRTCLPTMRKIPSPLIQRSTTNQLLSRKAV